MEPEPVIWPAFLKNFAGYWGGAVFNNQAMVSISPVADIDLDSLLTIQQAKVIHNTAAVYVNMDVAKSNNIPTIVNSEMKKNIQAAR